METQQGIGTLDVNGHPTEAEILWFGAPGQPKVKFKVRGGCHEG
jgi:hypothetical protein